MTEAMSYKAKLSIGGTVVEFVSCDIKETRELLDDEDGIRGTRSRVLERATQGHIKVSGSIKMNPTPLELATVFPFACGNSGTSLTDAMQDVTIVKDLGTVSETYAGARVNKLKIEGKPGKKLDLTLDIVGKTCTMGSGGGISTIPDITVRPYMMQDAGSGLTISGGTYAIDEFEFEIDNKIDPTFMQGQTATDLEPTDREVNLKVRLKYTGTEAGLLTTAQAGPAIATPATGSIAFTNGTNSFSLTFGALVAAPQTVGVTDKKKLRLPLSYRCYKVGTTLEAVTVLV